MGIANDKEIFPLMSSKVNEDKGKHWCYWHGPLPHGGYMLASGGVGNAFEKMPSGISSPSYIREKPSPYL